MLLYTRVAPPKVPKRRSRAGCAYCKEKKKKCDEIRPQCSRCVENDQECIYEPVKPRQRRKRDPIIEPVADAASTSSDDATKWSDAPKRRSQDSSVNATASVQQWREQQRQVQETSWQGGRPPVNDIALRTASIVQPVSYSSGNEAYGYDSEPLSGGGQVADDMFPWTSGASDLAGTPGAASSAFDFVSLDGTALSQQNEDDDVDEVILRQDNQTSSYRGSTAATRTSSTNTSNNPSLALIAPVPMRSPTLEFCAPVFEEFSSQTNRRALVDHFCNTLSHLIVFREENGNPFQQLVLPLSHSSPAVMHAMYALASAHLEYRGVQNREQSVYFHHQAIQGLARLIEKGDDVNKNELLAAIMLLIYYEVLVQRGRSNIVDGHLKGAMSIMTNKSHTQSDRASVFLERAFRFYDVIAALSFGTAPLSSAPGEGLMSSFLPLDSRGVISEAGSVDTLLGMATTLWPIIHRLSTLQGMKKQLDEAVQCGEVTKTAVLRTEFEASTSAIAVALREWQPTLPYDCVLAKSIDQVPADRLVERARLQSILNNALAYQHSALVYLYRTIHDCPRNHELVQRHTHLSLTHCVGTVSNEGPMGALLWPLFVAACEARDIVDRDLARRAFAAIDRRQGMTNIERAWCIVQEVWRRADEAEMGAGAESVPSRTARDGLGSKNGSDLWRMVSEDMGINIVFG